jgi:hypothetical protein
VWFKEWRSLKREAQERLREEEERRRYEEARRRQEEERVIERAICDLHMQPTSEAYFQVLKLRGQLSREEEEDVVRRCAVAGATPEAYAAALRFRIQEKEVRGA